MPENNPLTVDRRRFLTTTAAAGLALPFSAMSQARVLDANSRVRLAMIGCGHRGNSLLELVLAQKNVEVPVLCDADTAQMDKTAGRHAKNGLNKVEKIQDYREVLARDDIDAVVIATPHHWHVLHAIDAMKAGKAVYVEKPVSHDIWEGWQMAAAAKKYNSVISAGLQNRSDPGPRGGIEFVQSGVLGKIQHVHACCFRNRSSIGKQAEALIPPKSVDYNLWLGPAADEPMFRPKFHYDWHWVWNTGNGDMGNQCPHEIDMVNWLLGDKLPPEQIQGFGGRFGWNDAGTTPNMHTAWYRQEDIPVTIEVNDLSLSPKRNVPSMRNKTRVGIIVQCENGILRGGRGSMTAYKPDGKTKIERFSGDGGKNHMAHFIQSVRAGNCDAITSTIESAVRSAAIMHLANLSYRAGQPAKSGQIDQVIGNNAVLQTIVADQAKHLAAWGIDQPEYTLGPKAYFNQATMQATAEGARPEWIRAKGRGEFIVPEIKAT
ncbi:MAG: Gfo/Idh/MocA family oxidoreductase [Verrucomicrobiae bacterium]|nr:Gfo/Idh/MocA family oxidoreductase [Verrucomicrobiae bacterium]NNJ85977.1 Gfo/Idh/MocA family oxidoreductase [Akkermansiaceae bacterium]